MQWLLARQIRPFIKLAAFASLLLNLALLAPALYMLQVFDRVFASGSIETLVMLGVPVLVMLVLGYYMDAARGAHAGRRRTARRDLPRARGAGHPARRAPRPARVAMTMRCATSRSCASCWRVPAWWRCSTRPGCRSIY